MIRDVSVMRNHMIAYINQFYPKYYEMENEYDMITTIGNDLRKKFVNNQAASNATTAGKSKFYSFISSFFFFLFNFNINNLFHIIL